MPTVEEFPCRSKKAIYVVKGPDYRCHIEVNDFREENLAVKTDDNYVRLTPLGEYLMDSYASLVADLRQVARVDDFFDAVSPAGSPATSPDASSSRSPAAVDSALDRPKVMARPSRKEWASPENNGRTAGQVDSSLGKEMSSMTRAIMAGLKGLAPSPP